MQVKATTLLKRGSIQWREVSDIAPSTASGVNEAPSLRESQELKGNEMAEILMVVGRPP